MRSRLIFALVAAVGLLPASLAAQDDSRPGIAVMPFENGGSYGQDSENFEALTVGLQQMLTTEFSVNPSLRVVERSRIRDLLQEQDLAQSGRVDQATATRVGRLVGARYMVFGSFTDFYGDMRMDVRVVNVETSEIVKTEKVNDRRENLYSMVVDLAADITSDLNLPDLPQQVRSQRESREVPTVAVQYYTRAILWADRGNTNRAAELFSQALDAFPEYTEAREALQQLQQG